MRSLPVTVFADFTCPFSYLSEAVLLEFDDDTVELRFRAFELFPVPSALPTEPWKPAEEETLASLASELGVTLRAPATIARTRKAHEAALFARLQGHERAFRQAVYSAVWSDGLDIARIDTLADLASRVGLEGEDLKIALDIDQFAADVHRDADVATRLRIPGTPTIFLGTGPGAAILVGARPAEELRTAVQRAIHNRPEQA
jgi:predicted DsbA family dithiol-disulfide isomerase